jgi:hypothetical protein
VGLILVVAGDPVSLRRLNVLGSAMNNVRLHNGQARRAAANPRVQRHGPALPTLAVTGAMQFHGYLCLEYVVTPVPSELQAGTGLHEGETGVAIGDCGVVYRDCRSAYRRSADGSRVIGVLKINQALRPGTEQVRVLFAPLAHTPEMNQALCEVELGIRTDRVELISIRWM